MLIELNDHMSHTSSKNSPTGSVAAADDVQRALQEMTIARVAVITSGRRQMTTNVVFLASFSVAIARLLHVRASQRWRTWHTTYRWSYLLTTPLVFLSSFSCLCWYELAVEIIIISVRSSRRTVRCAAMSCHISEKWVAIASLVSAAAIVRWWICWGRRAVTVACFKSVVNHYGCCCCCMLLLCSAAAGSQRERALLSEDGQQTARLSGR